jgi:phenylacetate-coenzyme A ligase PaaK-like adenylate-forming protein
VLDALAQEQLAGRLAIRPAQVFSGGEQLTTATREHISAAWGVEPFDQYLTTEAGFVAVECSSHAGMHICDDHVVVEVVDGSGAPVPAGAYGQRVLLSVLGSRTLPLIRYELDDAAAMAEGPCSCGRRSPRLLGVASQPRALLRLPGRGGGTVTIHPVVVTAVLDAAPVAAWQVVQEPDRLRVLVVRPAATFDPERIEDELRAALAAAGARAPLVQVETVPALIRSSSGKASLVLGIVEPPRPPAAQR